MMVVARMRQVASPLKWYDGGWRSMSNPAAVRCMCCQNDMDRIMNIFMI